MCLACLLLCKEEGSSPVFAITEMRDMSLYEVPLSLLGFGMGPVSRLPCALYYVGVKTCSRGRNVSSRGHMCFRCLMFGFSGPCELLFFFVLLPLGPELW